MECKVGIRGKMTYRNGPAELKGVVKTDQQLGELLQSFGPPEKALEKTVIVVIGDSGMTPIHPAEHDPVVDLPLLLKISM